MTSEPLPEPLELSGGPLSAAISNELVRLHRIHFGRGPTQTRTVLGDDMVVCRMTEPFTVAERSLVALGHVDAVRAARRAIRAGFAVEFSAAVESLVRRPVVAWASDLHFDPDLAIEVFVLRNEG